MWKSLRVPTNFSAFIWTAGCDVSFNWKLDKRFQVIHHNCSVFATLSRLPFLCDSLTSHGDTEPHRHTHTDKEDECVQPVRHKETGRSSDAVSVSTQLSYRHRGDSVCPRLLSGNSEESCILPLWLTDRPALCEDGGLCVLGLGCGGGGSMMGQECTHCWGVASSSWVHCYPNSLFL